MGAARIFSPPPQRPLGLKRRFGPCVRAAQGGHMSATAQKVGEATHEKATVRKVIDAVKASGRTALTAPEAKLVCDAYGIPLPKEGLATAAAAAAKLAGDIGFPVVMKIVSADILHKTDAGGVKVGIKS